MMYIYATDTLAYSWLFIYKTAGYLIIINFMKRGKEMKTMKKLMGTLAVIMMAVVCCPQVVFAAEETAEYVPAMYATFWALIPPVVAIVLALITKEVYSSLFLGILVGGLF